MLIQDRGWANSIQLSSCPLNSPGNLFRDFPASGHARTLDITIDSRRRGEITPRVRAALGASKLRGKPFGHAVAGVHRSVELVDVVVEGIAAERHPGEQPYDPGGAVLDLAGL